MSILVRRSANQPQSPALAEWEPFRRMRDWLAWDPFQQMQRLAPEAPPTTFYPAFEVKETKEAYVFKADCPGIKEQDIEVNVTGNRLTITGKREMEQQDKTDTYYTYERTYGSFVRTFTLPDGVDAEHARAELKNGVLTLAIPKAPEAQPKKIEVKGGEKLKA